MKLLVLSPKGMTIITQDQSTLASNSSEQKQISLNTTGKYKTERCRYYVAHGCCPFGRNCSFAHQNWEMREKSTHLNYKTKLCNNFQKFGTCKYGDRCQFKHQTRKVNKYQTKITFWDRLDFLPNILQKDLFPFQPVAQPKRLKVFQQFSQDSFLKINWVYKKPRMYTI